MEYLQGPAAGGIAVSSSGTREGAPWLAAALLILCLIPNAQSLWIDEAFTVPYAAKQPFADFVTRLTHESGSEALMPLGMLSTWIGGRMLGQSEFALRLVSSIWAGIAVFLMWRIGVITGAPWLAVILASHPFIWYYGSEIRPYAMLIAMASGVLLGMTECYFSSGDEILGVTTLAVFGPLLFATHILAILPVVIASALVLVASVSRRTKLTRTQWISVAVSALVIAGIVVYYISAISRGAETAWHESPWSFSVASLFFSAYELGGFSGFGPGRFELRQLALTGGLSSVAKGMIRPAFLGAVGLLCLYAVIFVALLKKRRWKLTSVSRLFLASGAIVVSSTVATTVVFALAGNNVWGRHLTAVFPFLVVCIGLAAKFVADETTPVGRLQAPVGCLIALLLVSSLIVRFHPDHRREDYRTAARLANAAVGDGKTVWWAADGKVAEYYDVRFCQVNAGHDECVMYIVNQDFASLRNLPKPDLLVLSKPELHDRAMGIRQYIEAYDYSCDADVLAFNLCSEEKWKEGVRSGSPLQLTPRNRGGL